KDSNDLNVRVTGKARETLNNYPQAYEKHTQQVGIQRSDGRPGAPADTTPVVAPAKGKKAVKPAKKPVLPTVPKEAVTTERSIQTVQAKQAESKQVASAGKTQIEATCRNPNLADWAPVPCPNV
ncbi:type VI secretion-associated lipoprotein TagQ, partial [Pseudomonas carnis]|nr:type VI secretion-associated lipoprotein TagQ [Pseudomonas carnis]